MGLEAQSFRGFPRQAMGQIRTVIGNRRAVSPKLIGPADGSAGRESLPSFRS